MKKSRILAAAVLIAVFTAAAVALPAGGKAEAVATRRNIITDDFNVTALSGDWTAEGAALHKQSEDASLRLIRPDVWQPAVLLQNEAGYIDGARVITFDIQLVSGKSWLGLVIGAPSASSAFYEANQMLMVAETGVEFWASEGNLNLVKDPAQDLSASPMNDAAAGRVSVKLELTPTDGAGTNYGKPYSLRLSWGEKGAETLRKEYPVVYGDGYFGFCGQAGLVIDIFDFKMTDGEGNVLFEDDFSASTVSYPTGRDTTADWNVTHVYGPDRVYFGFQQDLAFSADGHKAVINTELTADHRVEQAFAMTFDLKLDAAALGNGAYFGVGLGLSATSDRIDGVNFVGLKKEKSGTKVTPVVVVNGVERKDTARATSFDASSVTMSIVGYYDGRVEIRVGDSTCARFDSIRFDGYAALGVVGTVSSGEPPVAAVDNFSLNVFEYMSADTPDSAQDFAGVHEFEDNGDILYEHYINNDRWLITGTGVTFPLQYTQKYLSFSDATGVAAFGLKERYSEFILRFTVTNTKSPESTKKTAPIAVSVGRTYIDSAVEETSAVLFNDNNGTMTVSALNAEGGTFASDVNFYADNTAYNVMVVVAGREMKVYYKAESAPDSDFGILRAHFTDVDSYGFVAVTCDTRDGRVGNFRITDFSVTNISPVLEENV